MEYASPLWCLRTASNFNCLDVGAAQSSAAPWGYDIMVYLTTSYIAVLASYCIEKLV